MARCRANAYRYRAHLRMAGLAFALLAWAAAAFTGGNSGSLGVLFWIGIIGLPISLVSVVLSSSSAPVFLQFDKIRHASYLRSTPEFMEEWVPFRSRYNWFGGDYYHLVYNGVSPRAAVRWVQLKYRLAYCAVAPTPPVDPNDFVYFFDYIDAGVDHEEFYELWNAGIHSVDAMKAVLDNGIDHELVRALG